MTQEKISEAQALAKRGDVAEFKERYEFYRRGANTAALLEVVAEALASGLDAEDPGVERRILEAEALSKTPCLVIKVAFESPSETELCALAAYLSKEILGVEYVSAGALLEWSCGDAFCPARVMQTYSVGSDEALRASVPAVDAFPVSAVFIDLNAARALFAAAGALRDAEDLPDPWNGISLRDYVKDSVTGLAGTVVARSETLSGQFAFKIQPMAHGARISRAVWVDADRVSRAERPSGAPRLGGASRDFGTLAAPVPPASARVGVAQ